jgi:hypothetical protein
MTKIDVCEAVVTNGGEKNADGVDGVDSHTFIVSQVRGE